MSDRAPTWNGWTLCVGERRAEIRRSHGCWFAVVFDRLGRLSSGEYFSYGQPGALQAAKEWCESRLIRRRK